MGSALSIQNPEWIRQQQEAGYGNLDNFVVSDQFINNPTFATSLGAAAASSTLANNHHSTVTESVAAAAAAAAIASMASFANDNVKRVLFPMKLWDLVSLPDKLNPGVTWTPDGTRIVVDKARLQKGYLSHPDTPFRTRSVDSFVRQLHFYGFRKTIGPKESDTIAYYYHDYFQRERPELLKRMKRHYKHNAGSANNNGNGNVSNQRRPSSQNSNVSLPNGVAKDHLQLNFCRDHIACMKQKQKIDSTGAFVPSKISTPTNGPHNLSTKPISLLKPVSTSHRRTNQIVIPTNSAGLAGVIEATSSKVPETERKSLENVEPGDKPTQLTVFTITDNTKSAAKMSDPEAKHFWPDSLLLYGTWDKHSNQFNLIDAQFVCQPKSSIQQ